MVLQDIILPPLDEDLTDQIQFDLTILEGIRRACYLHPHTSVASGNLHGNMHKIKKIMEFSRTTLRPLLMSS